MEQAKHDFVARGELTLVDKEVPVIVRGTYPELGTDSMHCRIIPVNSDQIWGTNELEYAYFAKFHGITEGDNNITITGLTNPSINGLGPSNYMEGDALEFIIGDLYEFDRTQGSTYASMYIPPTPLADPGDMFIQSYDGTIKIHGDDASEGVKWRTKFGQAELIYTYKYQADQYGLDDAAIRIRKCHIGITVEAAEFPSLDKLLSAIDFATSDALQLLSFLARKRLNWYVIEANYHATQSSRPHSASAVLGRQAWLGYPNKVNSWHDLPVVAASLRLGLFEQLLNTYTVSPHRAAIDRTMQFIISTQEAGYLEARISLAYAALESMISGLGITDDQSIGTRLPKNDFEGLAKKLRAVIRDDVKDSQIAEGLTGALEQLNRQPMIDRVLAMLKRWQVPIDELWPAGADLRKELNAIFKRRNTLIHQGILSNSFQYSNDLARLRSLVELWILRVLDCPRDAINWMGIHRGLHIDA